VDINWQQIMQALRSKNSNLLSTTNEGIVFIYLTSVIQR